MEKDTKETKQKQKKRERERGGRGEVLKREDLWRIEKDLLRGESV